ESRDPWRRRTGRSDGRTVFEAIDITRSRGGRGAEPPSPRLSLPRRRPEHLRVTLHRIRCFATRRAKPEAPATPEFVMPGLGPGTHEFACAGRSVDRVSPQMALLLADREARWRSQSDCRSRNA